MIITGMPHSGKSTMLKNLRQKPSLVGFMFDNFHNIDDMYDKFPNLTDKGIDLVNRAGEIIFGAILNTNLDVIVEGVDFMSKEVLDIFEHKATSFEIEYRFFRLMPSYDKWYRQVSEYYISRRNTKFYSEWLLWPKDERLIEIVDVKLIEDFLGRNDG